MRVLKLFAETDFHVNSLQEPFKIARIYVCAKKVV